MVGRLTYLSWWLICRGEVLNFHQSSIIGYRMEFLSARGRTFWFHTADVQRSPQIIYLPSPKRALVEKNIPFNMPREKIRIGNTCDSVNGRNPTLVDMENLPFFIGFHNRWCRISSINSNLPWFQSFIGSILFWTDGSFSIGGLEMHKFQKGLHRICWVN